MKRSVPSSYLGIFMITLIPVSVSAAFAPAEPGSNPTLGTRYLGLGPSWMTQMGANGTAYELSGGFGWDTSSMMIQLGATAQIHSEAIAARSGVSLKGFLPQPWGGDFAPYIEGGFGLGFASRIRDEAGSPEATAKGFYLSGGFGIQVMRTADVHLDLGFRTQTLLDSNELGRPGSMSVSLQLFY